MGRATAELMITTGKEERKCAGRQGELRGKREEGRKEGGKKKGREGKREREEYHVTQE